MKTSMKLARPALLWGISIAFLLAQKTLAADPPTLTGTWEHKDLASGETITFSLAADGTGKFDDQSIKYTVAGDKINVTADGEKLTYTYKIEGDTMTVSGGNLDRPTAFTRKADAPKKGLLGKKINDLGAGAKADTPPAKPGAPVDPSPAQPRPNAFDVAGKVGGAAQPPAAGLTGKWVANDGTILAFGADGKLLYNDKSVPYKAADGKITITGDGGAIQWAYRVDNNKLVLTMDGENQTLLRVAGAPEAIAAKTPDAPAPPTSAALGIWQAADGDKLEIRADALLYQGFNLPAAIAGNTLKVSANGQTAECPFEVSGDTMKITIGGQLLTLKRVGGATEKAGEKKADAGNAPGDAKAAAGAKSIVGAWDSPDGTVIVRADGTTRSGGKEFKYQVDDKFITLSDDSGWVKIPYQFDGDKLVLGTGPTKTLTRAAAGPAGAAAGVWTVTESSIDPQFVMTITQYLTLFPDGSVGFAKTEGGATRSQVTAQLERFSSFKNNAGGGKTYGRWQADANGAITIQWQGAWANATWRGQIDPRTNKLTFPKSGILNEGTTQSFEKQ